MKPEIDPKLTAMLTVERDSFKRIFALWPRMWEWFRKTYPDFSSTWESTRLDVKNANKIPATSGVYTLVLAPNILGHSGHFYIMYVGKSDNLRRRFMGYARDKKGSNADVTTLLQKYFEYIQFTYSEAPLDSYLQLETNIITAVHAPLNKNGLEVNAIYARTEPAF